MKSGLLAVICCFLLIGAMAMPREHFSRRGRRFETHRSLDDDGSEGRSDNRERFENHERFETRRFDDDDHSENHRRFNDSSEESTETRRGLDDDGSERRSDNHERFENHETFETRRFDNDDHSENHRRFDGDSSERRTETPRGLDDDSSEGRFEDHREFETQRFDNDDHSENHRRFNDSSEESTETHNEHSENHSGSERRPETRSSLRGLSEQSQSGYALNYVYRWYNSNTGDNKYCCSSQSSGSYGYTCQGMGFELLKYQQGSSVPFYQLYNYNYGYFYTTSSQEMASAKRSGWLLQGNIGFVFTFQVRGSFALYRYYNSRTNKHLYTIYPGNENLSGWTSQGVVGYAFGSSSRY